jgi:SAM-dependent methyltransferase
MITSTPPDVQANALPESSWENWLQSPPGQYILQSEQKLFDQAVIDVFGYYALQIGLPQINTLQENRISLKLMLLAHGLGKPNKDLAFQQIEGIPEELPFADQSIDLVALPHVLEFAQDPHQILREVDRVLIPEGRVIISGFNPASLWGLRQYTGRLMGQSYLPSESQFLSLLRVKDWLKLLDYSVDRGHFACYRLPLRKEKNIARMAFLEKMGNRWWPIFGSVFLISAIKRHPGIRLVGRVPKQTLPALPQLNPATRNTPQAINEGYKDL